MNPTEFVLWGTHPLYGGIPIKLTGGTVPHCRREREWRESEGGWSDLVIRKDKTTAEPKLYGYWNHEACVARLRFMADEDKNLEGVWAAESARERCDEYAELVRFVLDGILP